jgi:putative ABC transport system permease protein
MLGLFQDIPFAFRTLLRYWRMTATAAVMLALVIGANTALFSLAHGVLMKPIEVRDIDRLAFVSTSTSGESGLVAPGVLQDWQRSSRAFSGLAGHRSSIVYMSEQGEPERVNGARVTPNFFQLLGGDVLLGRTFVSEEVEGRAANAVVISHAFWQRRFSGQLDAVGKTLMVAGEKYIVVGVMSRDFAYPLKNDLWLPIKLGASATDRSTPRVRVFGRLVEGASLESANQEISAMFARQKKAHQEIDESLKVAVTPFRDLDLNGASELLRTVLSASFFLLLVGCANIATQLLARALSRRKEIASRITLGASRGRIVQLLLTESLALSLVGGALGVLVAHWGINLAKTLFSSLDFVPGFRNAGLNPTTGIYCAVVAMGTGVIFGLAPALQLARTDLNEVLKESGRGHSGTRGTRRVREILIVAQVALALLVAFGAVTFGTLLQRMKSNKGFESKGMQTLTLEATRGRRSVQDTLQLANRVQQSLRRVPGVSAVASAYPEPYGDDVEPEKVAVEGWDEKKRRRRALRTVVSGTFFGAMGVPLRAGRLFGEGDGEGAPLVAVVSDSFATKFFPNQSPLGKRIWFADDPDLGKKWLTIVGVVGGISYSTNPTPPATVYLSHQQWASPVMTFLMRADRAGATIGTDVRRAVRGVAAREVIIKLGSYDDQIQERLLGLRLLSYMTLAFGLVALIIAAIGLNAATSFMVAERMNEVGVRAAIGATPMDALRFLMRRGSLLTGVGVLVGLVALVPAGRYLEEMFGAVGALDPGVIAGASALVLLVAAVGSFIPAAVTALREPVRCLRQE